MKDKNNLLDYNQWTLGEYNNNLNGLTLPTTTQQINSVSNDWSTIGEKCFKMISSSTYDYVRIWHLNNFQNKIIISKCNINTKATIDVLLREFDSNNEIVSMGYTKFTGCGEISLSLNSSDTKDNKFLLSVSNIPKDNILYIDNAFMSYS